MNFPLLVDTQKNLALLYGAVKKSDAERLNRLTIIIDTSGKIVKIDKDINPSTHGADLVEFFNSSKSSKNN